MNKIVTIIIICFVQSLFAQWAEIGPSGSWITCMKSLPQNPQTMFCGVLQGGAYISDSRGENWSLIPEIGEYNPVYDLSLLSDGTIYIASHDGLFISRNSGVSWEIILSASTWQVMALTDSIVAADTAKFVDTSEWLKFHHPSNNPWLISFDYGQTWQFWQGTVDSSMFTDYLLPHVKRGNMIVTADKQVFRTEGLRIFKTVNDTWTEWQYVDDLHPWFYHYCRAFLSTPDSGATCYAFTEYYDFHPMDEFRGGVFKSTDDWQSFKNVSTIYSATAMTFSGADLLIGKSDGEACNTNGELILYRTSENSSIPLGTLGGDITAIDAESWNVGELIVATESDIYKTQDYGANWYPSSTGIQRMNTVAVQVLPLIEDKERIIVAVHKGGIWSSDDDGNHWQCNDLTPYVLPGLLQQAPGDFHYLYAAGSNIFRSNNAGDSWEEPPEYSFPAHYYGWYSRAVDIAVDPDNPEHAFVHYFDHSMDHYCGIICAETFDSGNNWIERVWFDDPYNFSWKARFDSHRLWISKLDDLYGDRAIPTFMVIDSTWNNASRFITLPDSVAASFWCVNGDTCYVINTESARFYRSVDLGETWITHDFGELKYNRYWQDWAVYEPFGQLTLSPDKQFLFFVYPGTGVLFSADKGDTWCRLNDGLPTLNTYQVAFSSKNPHIAYLATENGFYKTDFVSNVRWGKDDKNLSGLKAISRPEIFCMNYPNPFNNATVILYELPGNAHVLLKLYNILGQEIRVLDDGLRAAGIHQVVWDGKDKYGLDMPSSLYFYRISVDDSQWLQVKKLLLVH